MKEEFLKCMASRLTLFSSKKGHSPPQSFLLASLLSPFPLGKNGKKSLGHCLTKRSPVPKTLYTAKVTHVRNVTVFFPVGFAEGRWSGEGPSPWEKFTDVFKSKPYQWNFPFPPGKGSQQRSTLFFFFLNIVSHV